MITHTKGIVSARLEYILHYTLNNFDVRQTILALHLSETDFISRIPCLSNIHFSLSTRFNDHLPSPLIAYLSASLSYKILTHSASIMACHTRIIFIPTTNAQYHCYRCQATILDHSHEAHVHHPPWPTTMITISAVPSKPVLA